VPALRKAPRQQRSQETVAVILEAAAQVFQHDGYAATTTNTIAERAGVSIGSVYQYFGNKDAILVALAEQQLEITTAAVTRVLAEVAEGDLSLRDMLAELVGCVATLHTDQPALHQQLFDLAPRTPDLVARFREGERQLAAALAEQLRRLGLGGPDPDINALLAVQGIEAQVHGALLDPPVGRTAEDCVHAIIDTWTRALAEPSGPSGK
jgi:AcrR family transcriptional regulator